MDAVGAYKQFIDDFVELSRVDIGALRIRRHGHSERTNDDDLALSPEEQQRKDFCLGLTPRDRSTLAALLDHARRSAIHDVLAHLEWKTTCRGLALVQDGVALPESPFDSMHFDFIARAEGEAWPDEK
jgi:hypothetical protein